MNHFDLAIIGAGPGGYSAALRAAANGIKVALIEKDEIGGVCLNRGCVPAKSWIASAETVDHAKHMSGIAENRLEYAIDFAKVKERQKKIVAQSTKGLDALLSKRDVTVIKGEARFVSQEEIAVKTEGGVENIKFDHAVIAIGVRPAKLFDLPDELALTNETIFQLESLPESILIIGGGYIGCEFASALSRFGVAVTVVELMDRLLPMEDNEVSATLTREFKKQKIAIHTGISVVKMEADGDSVVAKLADGTELSAEKTLVSIGRIFDTSSLGLDKAAVVTGEKGEIVTDDQMRTANQKIFAIGDIAGKNALAYTAYKEGAFVADHIAGKSDALNKTVVPNVVFTIPEIGSVGITTEDADDDVLVGKFHFRALARAHTTGEIAGFVKVLADKKSDILLGVHIIGPRATDLIHIASLAVSQNMTAKAFGELLFGHPTFAESMLEAVYDAHGLSLHQ